LVHSDLFDSHRPLQILWEQNIHTEPSSISALGPTELLRNDQFSVSETGPAAGHG